MSYDRAITVFSPDGHLFQVEYAQEAVKQGQCAIGVKGSDSVVIAIEKKAAQKLQDGRTIRKILKLDEHCYLTFAGLHADGRILINKAQLACQQFRLNYEDAMDVDMIARSVAEVQQRSTQSGGSRPYGVSTIIGGFNSDGTPQMWVTDPSGMCASWRAAAIGRNSQPVIDYMEKVYEDGMDCETATRFAIKSLLEVVESGTKNIELVVMKRGEVVTLSEEALQSYITAVEKEREEEAANKKRNQDE